MLFLEQIRNYINQLDENSWYRYLMIFMGGYMALVIGVLFFYYYSVSSLMHRLSEINDARETAQKILTKAQQVHKQRAEVNALLEEEPDFKIKGYLEELMTKLGLSNYITSGGGVNSIDREDNYRENIATYHFTGINMKQLTELLDEVEQNKRLFTKDLEIAKSKKIPNTIDVGITIATMVPKPKS